MMCLCVWFKYINNTHTLTNTHCGFKKKLLKHNSSTQNVPEVRHLALMNFYTVWGRLLENNNTQSLFEMQTNQITYMQ